MEYGSDPNEAVAGHPSGQAIDTIPALHQAARRWRGPAFAELLLDRGADPDAIWKGRSAYAVARIFGNTAFAEALAVRGASAPLSPLDAALARCAEGEAVDPIDQSALSEEDKRLLCRITAGPNRFAHLKALLAAGFDPDVTDEMGLPPLHIALWEGLADRAAHLLSLNPDLDRENDYGGDALDTTIHGAEFRLSATIRDHIACVSFLLKAGATIKDHHIRGCGREDLVELLDAWRSGESEG